MTFIYQEMFNQREDEPSVHLEDLLEVTGLASMSQILVNLKNILMMMTSWMSWVIWSPNSGWRTRNSLPSLTTMKSFKMNLRREVRAWRNPRPQYKPWKPGWGILRLRRRFKGKLLGQGPNSRLGNISPISRSRERPNQSWTHWLPRQLRGA